jgi:hypothetical protein
VFDLIGVSKERGTFELGKELRVLNEYHVKHKLTSEGEGVDCRVQSEIGVSGFLLVDQVEVANIVGFSDDPSNSQVPFSDVLRRHLVRIVLERGQFVVGFIHFKAYGKCPLLYKVHFTYILTL